MNSTRDQRDLAFSDPTLISDEVPEDLIGALLQQQAELLSIFGPNDKPPIREPGTPLDDPEEDDDDQEDEGNPDEYEED